MKQAYLSPVVQVLDLADEDILTNSPLSIKNATDPIDELDWTNFFESTHQ